jgi:hypothetical protein
MGGCRTGIGRRRPGKLLQVGLLNALSESQRLLPQAETTLATTAVGEYVDEADFCTSTLRDLEQLRCEECEPYSLPHSVCTGTNSAWSSERVGSSIEATLLHGCFAHFAR